MANPFNNHEQINLRMCLTAERIILIFEVRYIITTVSLQLSLSGRCLAKGLHTTILKRPSRKEHGGDDWIQMAVDRVADWLIF
jgi:hypothetical protein